MPDTSIVPEAEQETQISAKAPDQPIQEEAPLGSIADTVIDTVTLTQQEALETAETAGTAMLANLTRVQRSMAEFVSERLRKDMEVQRNLLKCKTLDDVRTVQSMFFRTAVDEYAREATRLFRLSSEMIVRSKDDHRT